MDLHDALAQIAEIRTHIAQAETFRGYRAGTVAASGLMALAGAAAQSVYIRNPQRELDRYLELWIPVAVASFLIFAAEIAWRSYSNSESQARRLTLLAVQQFAPSLVAGGMLTYAIALYLPGSAVMLPGLWSIVFSLGIFASCRLLPAATIWIGAYYLLAGTIVLALAGGDHALSPWTMAGTFGVGQLLGALILFFTLERDHGQA